MKILRRTLPLALAILLHASPARAQNVRLGDTVQPVRQSVYLEVDPTSDTYTGSTEIALHIKSATPVITLHALEVDITAAVLQVGDLPPMPLKAEAAENGKVNLVASEPIPAGKATLKLEFKAPFNRRSVGLYKYESEGTPYLSTQFEMTDARRCFPCFDEPSFKIPYQMTIKAPSAAKVYNNGAETKLEKDGEWSVHRFAETPPIPSYLVALAVGPYEDVPVPGLSVPGRIATPRGKVALAKAASEVTPAILDALQTYFGIPYAYGKLDQLAITEFPFGAMENAGMVTYREDTLLVNEATAQQQDRERVYGVIAHELAHQWFGNLVTMKWWDDLWLNEAFATWMANKVTAQLYPQLEVELRTYQNQAMGGDAKLTARPIRRPIRNDTDIMDGLGLNYTKGCAVLTMIERWIGPDTFRQGIRTYMEDHKFANAEAADLWNALGKASDKDVAAVLKSFTEQPGFPLLTVQPEGTELTLSQQRYAYAGVNPPPETWTFPLTIRYGAGGRKAEAQVLMDGNEVTVPLKFEPEWIFPDDGGVGYYRWSLPRTQLDALVAQRQNLSNREKIALLANLNGLYRSGTLSAGDNLAYASTFLKESHPSVISPALGVLASQGELFVNEGNRAAWRLYLKGATQPLIDRLGWTTRKGEPAKESQLRAQLLTMLARDSDEPEFLNLAQKQAELFLSEKGQVDPALADVYLAVAARNGDVAMVDRVKKALAKATDPQRRTSLLDMLGEFGGAEAQQTALALMLDPVVTPSDLRTLLVLNGEEEVRRQRLQSWLETNYAAVSGKLPSAFLAMVVSSQSGAQDLRTLAHLQEFYGSQPDPNGAIKRELDKMAETVNTRVEEQKRGQASFDAHIKAK